MTFVAQMYDGSALVRLVPLDRPVSEYRTPRLLPPRFAALDPAPAALVEVDRWVWSGLEAEGSMTAELWLRRIGIDLPADTDRSTMVVPVVWLHYSLAS